MFENWNGELNINIEATDLTTTVQEEFLLTVLAVNDAPLIISNPIVSGLVNQLYEYQIIISDPDNEYFYYGYLCSLKMSFGAATWPVSNSFRTIHPGDVSVRVLVTKNTAGAHIAAWTTNPDPPLPQDTTATTGTSGEINT